MLEFSKLYLGTVRVLPGVANLEFEFDCSIAFSFRDVTFTCHFEIFQKTDIKNLNLNFMVFLLNLKLPLQPCNCLLSECTQRMQILFPLCAVFYELLIIRSTGGAQHASV